MEEVIPGKILEEKDTNHALEASLGILEEVTAGQVSRESGQEEMEFPQRHRKVVDVWTIRPGGPKGRGLEVLKMSSIRPPRIQVMLPRVIGT